MHAWIYLNHLVLFVLSASFVSSNYGMTSTEIWRTVLVFLRCYQLQQSSFPSLESLYIQPLLLKLNTPGGDKASIPPPVVSNPFLHFSALNSAVYNQQAAIETHPQEQVQFMSLFLNPERVKSCCDIVVWEHTHSALWLQVEVEDSTRWIKM